jgi:cell division septation protein DedD
VAKSEDGEFELILGNRQLLSVFFIVVILLGVFFTMGYIVGRNSAPLTADGGAARKDSKPLVVDAADRPIERDTAPARSAAAEPSSESPASTAVQIPTESAAITKPVAASEPVKPEPRPIARAAAPPPSEPATGEAYLQLAATSKREADIMVDVLREKKFKALSAEIPEKPGTFRVLVGPVSDGTTNKTRADLQGAGFPGNAAIRRIF